ncbi:hypothetical protein YC2023_107208 [Brassica napus]
MQLIYEKLPKDIASLTSQVCTQKNTPKTAKNESLNGAFTVIQDKERIYYNIQKKWTSCRSQSPYPPAYVAPQRSGESRSLQDLWTSEPVRIVNHHANRTFYICCNKEVERLPLRELPSPLKELLGTPGFRVLISVANGMIAFTSTGAHVDHTITGQPGHSFT